MGWLDVAGSAMKAVKIVTSAPPPDKNKVFKIVKFIFPIRNSQFKLYMKFILKDHFSFRNIFANSFLLQS